MSNGNKQRGNKGSGGGGGGGGGNQQRRRRGSSGGGRQQQQQMPRGPVMTALGESTYEAVFDHGNEGYGVWFDGIVREDPTYKQYWKGTGTRPIFVRIEEDRILITKDAPRRPGAEFVNAGNEADTSDEPNGNGNSADIDVSDLEAAAAASGEDRVYSPEEAAQLFVEQAEAGNGADDDSASASADEPEADAQAEPEAEAKPAPRRKVVRKKKVDEDEAPEGDDSE